MNLKNYHFITDALNVLPDTSSLLGNVGNNVDEAGDQLIPTEDILQSSNAISMLSGLEVIVQNEINAFTSAASSLHGFVSVLQALQQQNNANLNSNLLYCKVLFNFLQKLKLNLIKKNILIFSHSKNNNKSNGKCC